MIDIINKQNEALKNSLLEKFLSSHDKMKLEYKKGTDFLDRHLYIYFKTNDIFPKTIFYIFLDDEFCDDYEYFSYPYRNFKLMLKANVKDAITGYDMCLDTYSPVMQNGFVTASNSDRWANDGVLRIPLRNIISDYVNGYIKRVYSKKLDEVNKKFLETQKTLSKIKDKIQKRENPVDIEKYQQTFELFQNNLKEFEDFLNIIKQK